MNKSILIAISPLVFVFFTSMTLVLKLKKIEISEGITAKLPADFIQMTDDEIATRYPSTKKPLAMYSSADRLADFGLNVTKATWQGKDLRVLKDIYKSTLYTLYSDVRIIKEEIKEINKENFIVLEFVSTADKTRKYTYLQYAIFNNRVYIFNFSSPENKMAEWQPVVVEMMNSVKVKRGKLAPIEYDPQMTKPDKGKNAKEVLSDQKSRKQEAKPASTTKK